MGPAKVPHSTTKNHRGVVYSEATQNSLLYKSFPVDFMVLASQKNESHSIRTYCIIELAAFLRTAIIVVVFVSWSSITFKIIGVVFLALIPFSSRSRVIIMSHS